MCAYMCVCMPFCFNWNATPKLVVSKQPSHQATKLPLRKSNNTRRNRTYSWPTIPVGHDEIHCNVLQCFHATRWNIPHTIDATRSYHMQTITVSLMSLKFHTEKSHKIETYVSVRCGEGFHSDIFMALECRVLIG